MPQRPSAQGRFSRADPQGVRPTVIADAAPRDIDRVRDFGADHVVERGPDVGAHVPALAPDGVPGLADGSTQTTEILPAIADGGALAELRGWSGPAERGITVSPVMVTDGASDTERLHALSRQVEAGTLTLHTSPMCCPPTRRPRPTACGKPAACGAGWCRTSPEGREGGFRHSSRLTSPGHPWAVSAPCRGMSVRCRRLVGGA